MRTLGVVAFLIAAGLGPTAAHAGEWLTDGTSACSVWDPLPVPEETVDWTGQCKDGKASGHGVLAILKAGKQVERNEGEFVDGKQSGAGFRQNALGRYNGTFKDGLFDGKGVYAGSDGMRYEGDWKNGNIEGFGKLTFSSGLRYEGHFRANSYSGVGSMIMPDGARYDGEYRLSTPHGSGVYKTADGSTYAGQWKHGCFSDGKRSAYIGVFPEDCGLSESPAELAAAPKPHSSREN